MNSLGAKIPLISRISSNVIRILGSNPGPMTLQGTNTYLIGTGEKRILIDSGDSDVPKYIESLEDVLKQEKATISDLILTHWHHDHVGGVKDVVKIANQGDGCKVWKFPRRNEEDDSLEVPQHIPISKLKDRQILAVAGAEVKVFHTPGHTTDHVILTMDDGATLFSGDCILGEGTAVFEDLHDYMQSLHKILSLKPSVIYPGHGNIINDPLPRIQLYIDHRNQREKQIVEVLHSNPSTEYSEMDIVKVIYKDTPEHLWPAAAYNVNHHLKKLAKDGVVQELERGAETLWIIKNTNSSL